MAAELLPILTSSEREALEMVLKKSSRYPTGRRNRALILLAIDCGLRASELVGHEKREGGGLRIRDVNLTTGVLTIRDAKDTRKKRAKKAKVGRTSYASPAALDALRAYWTDRAEQGNNTDPEALFFTTRDGGRVANREARAAFARYAARAGIPEENRHLHALRHTFGTALAANGAPLHVVSKALGHSSLSSTAVYIHASTEDVREALAALHGH